MRAIALILIASCLGTSPIALTACTQAQAANVISTIEGYLQYVSSFISIAQGIWAVISPLLGSSVAPAANAQFSKGVTDLQDASVALEDALAAARVANNPNPDLSALMANCTAAVDEVVAAISQYKTGATAVSRAGASLPTLQHMQAVLHGWR